MSQMPAIRQRFLSATKLDDLKKFPSPPTQVVPHTAVSGSASLFGFFNNPATKVNSHFYIAEDGTIEQYIPLYLQSWATGTANVRAISIEMWDNKDPANTPMTPAQYESLFRLLDWLCDAYPIERRRIRTPAAPGIGWHSMFGFTDPINLTGRRNNPWSPGGHTCPEKPKILQILRLIDRLGEPVAQQAGIWSLNDLAPTLDNVMRLYAILGRAMGPNYDGWGSTVAGTLAKGEDPRKTLEYIWWALNNPKEAGK